MADVDIEKRAQERRAYLRFLITVSAALFLCFACIFFGMAIRNDALIRETLLARARSLFQELLLAREWNASYGGVYVLKGPGVESNPWLADPDIRVADGRILTKRNPALMTREISEIAATKASFRLHITSLRPLNPGNAPDGFERKALEAFEGGLTETWANAAVEGEELFRYMGVLKTEESCLPCHSAQGYKIGEVRGGISVSFPIGESERAQRLNVLVIVGLGLAVSCGMMALLFAFFRNLRRKLDEARAELRDSAVHDSLTGLYNRRFALGRYEEEFAQALRTGTPLSCAIVDADDFKSVNDEYGHLQGDAVLRGIASILRDGLRPYDLAGRYGGEEFILLLPAASKTEAFKACERIREEVEAGLRARVEGLERIVTISVGIAALDPAGDTPSALLARADSALYRAKAAGKNRCEA